MEMGRGSLVWIDVEDLSTSIRGNRTATFSEAVSGTDAQIG
jgi:hypothetical protein